MGCLSVPFQLRVEISLRYRDEFSHRVLELLKRMRFGFSWPFHTYHDYTNLGTSKSSVAIMARKAI